ncbi:hypothetical protein KDA23_07245 [Candidatus Saccharibacteria bacterium]|nr:hypothetical protein [Candidatus Saccharibacteria bacterium]
MLGRRTIVPGWLWVTLAVCASAVFTLWVFSLREPGEATQQSAKATASATTSERPSGTASPSDSPAATPSESPGHDQITQQLAAIQRARYTINPHNSRQRRQQLDQLLPANLVEYASAPLAGIPENAVVSVKQQYDPEFQDIPGSDQLYAIGGLKVRIVIGDNDPVFVLYQTATTWEPTANGWHILSFNADEGVATTDS